LKNGDTEIAELEQMFADYRYTFRCFPEARIEAMKWQCGRMIFDAVEDDPEGVMEDRFELIAWSSTREGLIAKLAD